MKKLLIIALALPITNITQCTEKGRGVTKNKQSQLSLSVGTIATAVRCINTLFINPKLDVWKYRYASANTTLARLTQSEMVNNNPIDNLINTTTISAEILEIEVALLLFAASKIASIKSNNNYLKELTTCAKECILRHSYEPLAIQSIIKSHQDHQLCTNPMYTETTLIITNDDKTRLDVCKQIIRLMKGQDEKTQKNLLKNAVTLIKEMSSYKSQNITIKTLYNQIPEHYNKALSLLKKELLTIKADMDGQSPLQQIINKHIGAYKTITKIISHIEEKLQNDFIEDFIGRPGELKHNEPSWISKLLFEDTTTYAPAGLVHIIHNNGSVDPFNSLMEFLQDKTAQEQCEYILSKWANPNSFVSDPTNKVTTKKYGKNTTVFHSIFKNKDFYNLEEKLKKQVIKKIINKGLEKNKDDNNQTPLDILKQKNKKLYKYTYKQVN